MPFQISLAEVFASHGETLKDEIWTAIPAVIISVAGAFVDVQPLVKNPLLDEFGNVAGSETLPSISNVPLGVMRGGGAIVSVPVIPGDHVLLIFTKHSLDTYRVAGASPQDPGWVGKHTYDSCIAFPCIAPDARTPVDVSPTDVVIGFDGTPQQLRVNASGISLGKGATDSVALASKVDLILTAISTAVPVAGDGGAAIVAAVVAALATLTPPGTTGSLVVKSL